MVAHFDYHKRSTADSGGVTLISIEPVTDSQMYATADTLDGYANSIANTTTCPAIATALSTVLGSYLFAKSLYLSSEVDSNLPSMAGMDRHGATYSCTWQSVQCVLPTEPQIYGCALNSSSSLDTAESNEKLAVFNFIGWFKPNRTFWFRSIASVNNFALAPNHGVAISHPANQSAGIRPLIIII